MDSGTFLSFASQAQTLEKIYWRYEPMGEAMVIHKEDKTHDKKEIDILSSPLPKTTKKVSQTPLKRKRKSINPKRAIQRLDYRKSFFTYTQPTPLKKQKLDSQPYKFTLTYSVKDLPFSPQKISCVSPDTFFNYNKGLNTWVARFSTLEDFNQSKLFITQDLNLIADKKTRDTFKKFLQAKGDRIFLSEAKIISIPRELLPLLLKPGTRIFSSKKQMHTLP